MKKIKIGNRRIGTGEPVFVIGEAGVNHNGRLDLALKLVDAAAGAGADAIKFQTFKAEEMVVASADMAEYQQKNLGVKESQLSMLRKLEFKEEHYPTVIKRCKERGITFISTPHGGIPSIDLLKKMKHPAYKIASGDLTNRPYIEHAAKTGKPILLSTGMGTMREIQDAVHWIKNSGNENILVFHCTTNYPTPPEETNLRAMITMMKKLNVLIGYSDHTEGIQAAVMAATLGACMIEKHFTLDRSMEGPDHAASLEPSELTELVREVKNVERYMGLPEKKPTKSELKMRPLIRKSIVAARAIGRGEKITLDMLRFKRPATGISPAQYRSVVGKRAGKDLPKDHLLRTTDYGA